MARQGNNPATAQRHFPSENDAALLQKLEKMGIT